MKQELDEKLCAAYPKLFVNRHADMRTTAMCWGFACGDGWYSILNNLCGNIQNHINWKERQRDAIIKRNQMVAKMKAGDFSEFDQETQTWTSDYRELQKERYLSSEETAVPAEIVQVTVDQVKEKFGTLRFYYTGGDDYISGLVAMAESMSGVTCETCGNPGRRVGGGWITTLCKEHAEARDIYQDETDVEN
jgi:hypothetical protein